MPKLFGTELTKQELLKRVGNLSQIASIKPYTLNEGRANGLKAFDVTTGGGLDFTLLEGKCLDIYSLKYNGTNLNFVAKPGLVSPEYFNPQGVEFLRNFQAGALYTCGLSNVGPACNDDGVEHCLHGRIGHTPAAKVSAVSQWEGDEYKLEVSGEMREAALFNENLVLKRKISTSLGAKSIKIHDEVENEGFEEQALLILYHFNFGYPVLDADSRFVAPDLEVTPRDAEAEKGVNEYNTFSGPIDQYKEQVFYHKVAADCDGYSCAAVINDKLGLGIYVKFKTATLPKLVQWKSMMSGDYVLGIEPSNCLVGSRVKEKENGAVKMLSPFEKVTFDLELGILDGVDEIKAFENKVKSML